MLLTITWEVGSEGPHPATDLGFLLHKNPAILFEKSLSFGTARVFYPQATPERCTCALLVAVDPVGLVRGNRPAALAQYVSDRPYAPSSFLSVALAEVFGTALGGRSKERPELTRQRLALSAELPALACDGGEDLIRDVFVPLGYDVRVSRLPLDPRFPAWGPGALYAVGIAGAQTVQALLSHLAVLVPVLDNAKHYFVGDDEVDKLVRRGEGWLSAHPAKDLIARRYLRYKKSLADDALARLADVEGVPDADEAAAGDDAKLSPEQRLETPVRLNERRIEAAVAAVRALDPPARRVLDLGCGEGKTMEALLARVPGLEHAAGMDVSSLALKIAARRLHLDRMDEREQARVSLFHGSLVYRDARLDGYDAALLTEVIEHLDVERLAALVRVVWEFARPRRVIVTTPNAEYNSVWPSLPAGKFRHSDHRFEWTRAEFVVWAEAVAPRYGYAVTFWGVGDPARGEPQRGTPTQMAVFDQGRGGGGVP